MAYIEKVIKGLERCSSIDMCYMEISCYHPKYLECPYHEESECVKHLVNDALELLKEQEAVKPVPPEDEFGLYRCGKCYHQLFRCVDKYCSRCGKAVKWDDK